jgi:hypothetical protein
VYQDDEGSDRQHLPEAELQDIYRDLLSYSEADTSATSEHSNTQIKNVHLPDLLRSVEERLPTFEAAVDANAAQIGLSSRLLARMQKNYSPTNNTGHASSSQHWVLQENGSPIRRTIIRLRSVIDKMEAVWRPTEGESLLAAIDVSYGMLSNSEWAALSQACVSNGSMFKLRSDF